MLETVTLVTFTAMLVCGIVLDLPLLGVLVAGWLLFFDYGLLRGHDMGALARMSSRGLRSIKGVLVLFALIGALTASWRAAGTIPAITCWSARVVTPATLVPATFLLCCAMSLLTGSSFAAAATTGVICMTIATSMGANLPLVGGAIISGSFIGDHVGVGVVPFVGCCVLYAGLGAGGTSGVGLDPQVASGIAEAFRSFDLSPVVLVPVGVVFALCLLRVNVRLTMVLSLLSAVVICVTVQGMTPGEVGMALVCGYHAADPAVARLANGGGICSMAEIAAIVTVASTYSGLFEGTRLLDGLGSLVSALARRVTPFVGVLVTSVVTAAIACDQVVAIMLVRQLCDECERADTALALDLESSVALVPALIPWSTSCVGIVAFTGMPVTSVLCAFLPMLVPLWSLCLSLWQHAHPSFVDGFAARAMGLTEQDDARRIAASEVVRNAA